MCQGGSTRSAGFVWASILIALLAPVSASYGESQSAANLPDQKRPISVDDYYAMRAVSAPAISFDGSGVAYIVGQPDKVNDTTVTTLWCVDSDGGDPRELTHGIDNVTSPAFSPDGSLVSFISDRSGANWDIDEQVAERGQVYAISLTGGEAFPLTSVEGGVRAYLWSPDGSRLAVVSMPPKTGPEHNDAGRAVPVVVTRLKHKYDGQGYLDRRTTRIYDVPVGEAMSVIFSLQKQRYAMFIDTS